MAVKFEDNSIKVKAAISTAMIAWLYESAGDIEAQAKQNTKVDSGQTKGSWGYAVDESAGSAAIGSNYENAIWEEFGTGEYALYGDGRKGGWVYEDEKGNHYYTKGKQPRRMLWNAFNTLKNSIIASAEAKLRGLG
ncbi:MAG: HK97 gp10 family phage protein [Eubacteriales bacterium]